jgi:2-oxo-4-hydroxy-4-carboxy-5-ureidoimidazoline decarboxylase
MHQGIGLDRFNAVSFHQALHALYECCSSLAWAIRLAAGRPYESHAALHSRADDEMFSLSNGEIDAVLECHRGIATRAGSTCWAAEQCALSFSDPAVAAAVARAAALYEQHFGHRFVLYPAGMSADDVLRTVRERLGNDIETEQKILLNELAHVTWSRLERMLGPEGGYLEYWSPES